MYLISRGPFRSVLIFSISFISAPGIDCGDVNSPARDFPATYNGSSLVGALGKDAHGASISDNQDES